MEEKTNSLWQDWSGLGSSHVDFARDEIVPLQEGRFLGYGTNGGVYETTCMGERLAWKRKYCRRKVGHVERKEIEILKKLSHRHIIKLVGTYTHLQFLGMLLWPVAVCDLATLLEDLSSLLLPIRMRTSGQRMLDYKSQSLEFRLRQHTIKQGYLAQRLPFLGISIRRYCVLDGSKLHFYKPQDQQHLGTIHLSNATIQRWNDEKIATRSTQTGRKDTLRYAIQITEDRSLGTSSAEFHLLFATTEQERDEWLDILEDITVVQNDEAFPPPSIIGRTAETPVTPAFEPEDPSVAERFHLLGLYSETECLETVSAAARRRLMASLGCIANALAYVHYQGIRHKDLKPSNVLLGADSLWITDFECSTDFSELAVSTTANGERGTLKYCAPEVAAYKSSGRSSDIFSLGCVFLEILAVGTGRSSQEDLKILRPNGDKSYQANLCMIDQWLDVKGDHSTVYKLLLAEVRRMLNLDPVSRPTVRQVVSQLGVIESSARKIHMPLPGEPDIPSFHGLCCMASSSTT
jgi:hypothetical protein